MIFPLPESIPIERFNKSSGFRWHIKFYEVFFKVGGISFKAGFLNDNHPSHNREKWPFYVPKLYAEKS